MGFIPNAVRIFESCGSKCVVLSNVVHFISGIKSQYSDLSMKGNLYFIVIDTC